MAEPLLNLCLNNELQFVGKVGREISLEVACQAARLCASQCLSVLEEKIGGLQNIAQILKVTGFVASAEGWPRRLRPSAAPGWQTRVNEVLRERFLAQK